MEKIKLVVVVFLLGELSFKLFGQTAPTITGQVVGEPIEFYSDVLWYQMDSPGTSSIASQNFETANDLYDSFAADDFGLMDDIWSVTQIDLLGAYFNGAGPASSVNVWFYSDSAGLPNQIIYAELNIIPVNGLTTGSFSIILSNPVVLNEGMYWFCIQANMDLSPFGQWGWTERTITDFSESAWKNPGGGFGTMCNNWKHRVTECGVGTGPDLCFSLIGDIIPVEMTSFEATAIGNSVELKWSTATEINNLGFEIERKEEIGQYHKIGFVLGYGTTTEIHKYDYTDENLSSGSYSYRLKQVDLTGTFEYSKSIEVEVINEFNFSIEQNYPNPFNPSTVISYQLPLGSNVSLKVFDVLGNEVAILVDEYRTAGSHEVEFRPESSIKYSASGVYFYQLKTGNFIQTKKMILIK
jgi:hypothetical protein